MKRGHIRDVREWWTWMSYRYKFIDTGILSKNRLNVAAIEPSIY